MAETEEGGGNEMKDEVMESEGEEDAEERAMMENSASGAKRQAYVPGISRGLKSDEELDFDESAYKLFHTFSTEYPCLSFDTILDNEGDNRDNYPVICRLVAGTQADRPRNNGLVVMKLTNLTAFKEKKTDDERDESESESESDEEEEESKKKNGKTKGKEPIMHAANIPHHGGINRLRTTNLGVSRVCAVWNDQAKVQLWNLTDALKAVEEMDDKRQTQTTFAKQKPLYSFVGHQSEGYAIDWSSVVLGRLASGDNLRRIHLWTMGEGGQWAVDQRPLTGHTGSVEDIQWSPNEDHVVASCSSDGSIRLWDGRSTGKDACVCTVANAHDSDVNVISWNPLDPSLLLSGGDDGQLKIWDLKMIQYGQSVARFKHHTAPVTSVHWYGQDSTVFIASAEDDQTTIWDLALEADQDAVKGDNEETGVAPQLLFIHMGQTEVKEVRWHRQLTGMAITTALSGFNIFRTINV